MSSFNERLAHLADQVRNLTDGDGAARELLALAADVDAYLAQQRADWYRKRMDWFEKYSEFLNSSVVDANQRGAAALIIERRTMARAVASDPRWQGGYADVLTLFEDKETDE